MVLLSDDEKRICNECSRKQVQRCYTTSLENTQTKWSKWNIARSTQKCSLRSMGVNFVHIRFPKNGICEVSNENF